MTVPYVQVLSTLIAWIQIVMCLVQSKICIFFLRNEITFLAVHEMNRDLIVYTFSVLLFE